ncbi:MAG: Gldg family protein [Eubacteriales bacterium]|nr:Gldg family protein [Eubacteriales bacterium]
MKKKFKYGSVAAVSTAVCIVAAVLINILFTGLDSAFDLSADFSGSRITGIDSVSADIVGRLPYGVEIIVNGNEDDFRGATYDTQQTTDPETGETKTQIVYSGKRYTAELLDSFRQASDKISVSYIDTRYNPGYFKERNIILDDGVYITVYCPQTQKYSFIYDDVFSGIQYIPFERQLDAAMRNTTMSDVKKIGIVKGHGEEQFPYFEELLRLNGYEVELNADLLSDDLAKELDILVIINPKTTYSSSDISALRDYLYHDGAYDRSLAVFMDNSAPENPLLEKFLSEEWGLTYTTETVFDPANSSTVADAYEPFLKINYGTSVAAKGIAGTLADDGTYLKTALGKTRAINIAFENKNTVSTTPLLSTFGKNSFGRDYSQGSLEVGSDNFASIEKQDGDSSGPHIIGAMGYVRRSQTLDAEEKVTMSSVVCFGTTSLLDTYYLSNAAGYTPASGQYTLGIFSYLSHDDSVVRILSSSLATGVLEFDSDRTTYTVAVVCIALVPAICAAVCIVTWRKRKYL